MISAAIIADSSPLISLAIIDQLELLPQLYERVIVPTAVWDEVTLQGAGLPGAQAVSQIQWFEIQTPEKVAIEPFSMLIDRGEAEAIAIAQSISNSIVLLDDAKARRVAERLGVARIGTLGILRRAKNAGLITEIKEYIELLQINGIYMRQSLVEAVLQDVGEIQ